MIETGMLPTLRSPRLVLRQLNLGDFNSLFAVFSDPQVMRYWSRLPMTDSQEAVELFQTIEKGRLTQEFYQWGIARLGDDVVIGTCTLFRIDQNNRRAELGFALGRAHWKQGLMSEALHVLLKFAFDSLNLHRLEADADPRNAASISCLQRQGFQQEGYLRERWLVGGDIQDALFFGLLQKEWRSRFEPS
jgi:RimJ/RimL family protein N-acetyltransferase